MQMNSQIYPALNTPINDEFSGWDSTSWSEYREQVHNLAAGLIDIGFSMAEPDEEWLYCI